MIIAKIIRHRHRWEHSINGSVKEIEEKNEFKIVFSHPGELRAFEHWCKTNNGEYVYNKEENKNEGKLPELVSFKEDKDLCWCDIMQYYLLHVAGYFFDSALSPYTGEIYHKTEPSKSL